MEEVLSASLDLLEGVEGPAPPVPGSEVFKSNMAWGGGADPPAMAAAAVGAGTKAKELGSKCEDTLGTLRCDQNNTIHVFLSLWLYKIKAKINYTHYEI